MRDASLRVSGMVVLAGLTCLSGLGCNGDDEVLDVATYNAGLAPGFVPLTAERGPRTIEALAAQGGLDVVCVQELWLEESVRALEAATAERWPNTIFPPPDPGTGAGGGAPACEASEIDPLQACVLASCADVPAGELAMCVLGACQAELGALPSDCSTCLAANIGASFEEIRLTCSTSPGSEFAFGGSFGLGLLTDAEILEQDFLLLDSTFNRRGVIYARLDTPQRGPVNTFCTHLTPIFDDIPFPGAGSWEDEQAAQIDALLAFVEEKAGADEPVVLLGDMNTGPALDVVAAEAPDNYARLVGAGFDNPYVQPQAACTFCADNPLVSDDADSVVIDHVLVRGLMVNGTARRFLTEDITVEVDGNPVPAAYSDHYGVAAGL